MFYNIKLFKIILLIVTLITLNMYKSYTKRGVKLQVESNNGSKLILRYKIVIPLKTIYQTATELLLGIEISLNPFW